MAVRYERVKVTRNIAKRLLDNNLEWNRNPKFKTKVSQYAIDMREGRWDTENGDTIRVSGPSIDEFGKLIDGQNRMHGFLESGLRYMWFDFAFGVKEESYPTIDAGAARTFADTLRGEGEDTGPERLVNSAVIRRVFDWERGLHATRGNPKARPTHTQLLERWRADRAGFVAASKRGADISRNKMGQASIAGTAYYLFAKLDPGEAQTFFEYVLTGANLPDKHPALTLGRRLMKDRLELTAEEQLILWIKAWNAFRADELPASILTTGYAGKAYTNDNFPEPK